VEEKEEEAESILFSDASDIGSAVSG